MAVRCPGRDYEDWPAKDIDNFLDPPPWPFDGPLIDNEANEYPQRTTYQMRGWEQTSADWKTPDQRQSINSDIMLNLSVLKKGHDAGLNVGYSDVSVTFISGATPYRDTDLTFFEQMHLWQPSEGSPIGIMAHLESYQWFDTQ